MCDKRWENAKEHDSMSYFPQQKTNMQLISLDLVEIGTQTLFLWICHYVTLE